MTLEGRGLRRNYRTETGSRCVLDAVHIAVDSGELVCLVGPSGCGKSTLMRILAGLEPPDDGTVLLDGVAAGAPDTRRVLLFQDQDQLFPWQDVVRAVGFPIYLRGERDWRARAHELIELVGLSGFERHYPYQLSGGMRQRVALARALAAQPRVLLMDEPFAGLDALTRSALQDELALLNRARGTTILFVTHDIAEALRIAGRILVMDRRGRIVLEERSFGEHTAQRILAALG